MIQLFGSERVLLTDSGEARPLTAHKLNKMELGQEVQLYLDHGQWVTREEHRRILAELRCECYGDEIKKEKVDEGKSEEDKYQPLKNDQGL